MPHYTGERVPDMSNKHRFGPNSGGGSVLTPKEKALEREAQEQAKQMRQQARDDARYVREMRQK